MPKPIYQRGFFIEKEIFEKGTISYSITPEGDESICIEKNKKNSIYLNFRESVVTYFNISTPQFDKFDFEHPLKEDYDLGIDFESEQESGDLSLNPFPLNFKLPKKNIELCKLQAMEIYETVKRILKVDENLKNYVPQFSNISELNLYSVLGIDGAGDLENLVRDAQTDLKIENK